MIDSPLDQLAGISTFILVPLMILVGSLRAQLALSLVLAAVWFAWTVEKKASQ